MEFREAHHLVGVAVLQCQEVLKDVDADRIEDDGAGCSWWTVVVVIHDPWWSCIRRVSAIGDLIDWPFPT